MLGELGSRLEQFSSDRQSQLDRELEFIEYLRFSKGVAQSEKVMIEDRAAAVRECHESRDATELMRQRLQRIRASAVEGSSKVAAAVETIRAAEQRQINATLRLEAMSNAYHDEVEWCNQARISDMKAYLLDFVQLQRDQAQSMASSLSLRSILEAMNATDAELKASHDRIGRISNAAAAELAMSSPTNRNSAEQRTASASHRDSEDDAFDFLEEHECEERFI